MMSQLSLVIFTVSFCILGILGIWKVLRNDKDHAKITVERFKLFMHPNAITIWGGIISIVGMFLYYFDYPRWGIEMYIIGLFADMLDGIVARELDLITSLGKKLDPFMDKVKYFIPLIYFASEGMLPWKLVLLFLTVDLLGQYLRNIVYIIQKIGLSFATAANNFGKTKAVMASILVVYCFLLKQHVEIPNFAEHTLWLVFTLAVLSVAFKFTRSKKTQEV